MYRVYGGGGADDDDDLDDRRRQELEDELYREPDDENSGGLRGGGEEAGDRMPVGSSLDPAGAGRAADRPPNGENTETHGAGRSQPGRARGSSAGLRDVSAANNEGCQDNSSDSIDSDIEERLWSSVAFCLESTPIKPTSNARSHAQSSQNSADTLRSPAESNFAPRRQTAKKKTRDRVDIGDEFIVISSSEDEELTQSAKKHARDRNDEELKYHLGRKRPRSPAGGRRDRLYYTAASRSSSLTPSDSSDGEGLREIRGDREHSASDVARPLDAASAVGDVNRGLSNAYEKLKVTKVIDLDEVVVPEGTAVNPDAFGELETNEGYGRYFMPQKDDIVCARCKQKGHSIYKCRTPMCWNCGGIGHVDRECPNFIVMICRYCNRRGHRPEDCKERRTPGRLLSCGRCGSQLHRSDECHLMWRIYVERKDMPEVREVEKWCYNCAQRGHFGDHCREPRHREYSSSGKVESGFSDVHFVNSLTSRRADRPSSYSRTYSPVKIPYRDVIDRPLVREYFRS